MTNPERSATDQPQDTSATADETCLPQLPVLYTLANPDAPNQQPPVVLLTGRFCVRIPNRLTLTIANNTADPITFAGNPGFDHIDIYFPWGGFGFVPINPPVAGGQLPVASTIPVPLGHGGFGYSVTTPPQVSINDATGTNAAAVATVKLMVIGVQLTSCGSGYADGSQPEVWFDSSGVDGTVSVKGGYGLVRNGRVAQVVVTNGGSESGYVNPPKVRFVGGGPATPPAAPLVPAVGVAQVTGTVVTLTVTDPGSGYSAPSVTIAETAGKDALCTRTEAGNIQVSPSSNDMSLWSVAKMTDVLWRGVYWRLSPKDRYVLEPKGSAAGAAVSFELDLPSSSALGPGSPVLQVQPSIAGYKVELAAGDDPSGNSLKVTTQPIDPPQLHSFAITWPDGNDATKIPKPAVDQFGGPVRVTLTWSAYGADYVTWTPDHGNNLGQLPPEGQISYALNDPGAGDTEWPLTLQAFTRDRTSSAPVTPAVLFAPTIRSFRADPQSVPFGDPFTLMWEVTQASGVSYNGIGLYFGLTSQININGDRWFGNYELNDENNFSQQWNQVDFTTTYTLGAVANDVSKTVEIQVVLQGLNLHVWITGTVVLHRTPVDPQPGPTFLNWNITGPTKISIDEIGPISATGSRQISLGFQTFTFNFGNGSEFKVTFSPVEVL